MNKIGNRMKSPMTIKEKTRSSGMSLKTILVPIDFSTQSLRALHFAEELVRRPKTAIVLVHVLDPLHAPGRLGSQRLRRLRVEALEEADARLAEISKDKRNVEHHVINGMIHAEIVKFANKINADLIVMGSNGRTGVKRFIEGSIAEKVVRHAKGPVLVVRS